MMRPQVIRFYLTAALKKRLWAVVLSATVVGVLAFALTGSRCLTVPITLMVTLSILVRMLLSSRRHVEDFPTYKESELADVFRSEY